MKQMWSPWRSKYIESFSPKNKKKRKSATKGRESIFTLAEKLGDDDKYFIVWRGCLCFVIMNLYPYNSGHLMVVPYRQVSKFADLTPDECSEVMATSQRAVKALDKIMSPQGYNFGANIGRVSGAGVENHIHFHIVPRWNGDTNFMPVLGNTKVISTDMRTTLKQLRKAFKSSR
ncbi:MAG: HIT family protein [Bacteroidota bacterium]